jgi:hypothetical protein
MVAVGVTLLGVLGTVVSMSRTSLLSAAVAASVFSVLSYRQPKSRGAFLIPLIALLAGGLGLFAYTESVDNLDAQLKKGMAARWSKDGVVNDGRLEHWREYSEDIVNNPWLGKGAGYLKTQSESGHQFPHNSFFDIAVEFGLPALILYVAAFVRSLTAPPGVFQDTRVRFLYSCFLGMLTSLITLSSPFNRPIWAVAGAVCGGCTMLGVRRVFLDRPDGAIASEGIQGSARNCIQPPAHGRWSVGRKSPLHGSHQNCAALETPAPPVA